MNPQNVQAGFCVIPACFIIMRFECYTNEEIELKSVERKHKNVLKNFTAKKKIGDGKNKRLEEYGFPKKNI